MDFTRYWHTHPWLWISCMAAFITLFVFLILRMNYGSMKKHPADSYWVWLPNIHQSRRTWQACFSHHEKPFCPKQVWTGGCDQAHEPTLCFPSTSDNNFTGLQDFCYEKKVFTGNGNTTTTYLCAFHWGAFWGKPAVAFMLSWDQHKAMPLTSYVSPLWSASSL